jgi:hypothetical protein
VRAQERRAHPDAERVADAARDPQHFAFVVEIQTVAGFDFQRGRAIAQQRLRARQRLREQRVFAGLAHRAHGREDAAAGARDLLVSCAFQPPFEFVRAVAGEHDMRMAIDQAGRDPAAIDFDDLSCQRLRRLWQRAAPTKRSMPSFQASAPSSISP